ncbi:hypothetical protein ACFW04_012767 [Cataglyphis niger]
MQGYNYIVTVIDVFSKYAWTVPLKSKSGNEMSETIATIIRDNGRCPKNFQTDRGKEFYNANVQKLIKIHNINHYSTYSLVGKYNERKHRTIDMRPIDVIPAITDKLLNTVCSNVKIAALARFKVVSVRVSKF